MVHLRWCGSGSLFHILPRQEREVFRNATNVCISNDVYRSSEFNFVALSYAYWEDLRRLELEVFGGSWVIKTHAYWFLDKHVKSIVDILVLNCCRHDSHADGSWLCTIFLQRIEKDIKLIGSRV